MTHICLPKSRCILPYMAIVAGVVFAWFPSVGPYIPLADDMDLFRISGSFTDFLRHAFAREGVWRILQAPLVYYSYVVHPLAATIAAIIWHLAATLLFFRVAHRLIGQVHLSLTLALGLSMFPWAFQALLWYCAIGNVICTMLFWLNLLLLAQAVAKRRMRLGFSLSLLLVLVAMLVQENLAFAFAVSGALFWVSRRKVTAKTVFRRMRRRYVAWAPSFAVLIWIILFTITRTPESIKGVGAPRLRAIVSTYWYQYSNLDILQPWLSWTCINAAFTRWTALQIAFAIATLLIFVILLQWSFNCGERPRPAWFGRLSIGVVVYCTALLVALSSVYVAGGGYSLESRKRYPILPVLALITGLIVAKCRLRVIAVRHMWVPVAALMIFGAATSWLVIGIYRVEARKVLDSRESVTTNELAEPEPVHDDDDLYKAWPNLGRQNAMAPISHVKDPP